MNDIAADSSDLSLAETRLWLEEHADDAFGKIPAKVIAAHIIDVTHGADFPVRRAALDALARRMGNATTEQLHVAEAPKNWLGRYVLARRPSDGAGTTPPQPSRSSNPSRKRAAERRPYDTVVDRVDPPRGECSCPDFVKGSLGLCKHLLTALVHIYDKPRALEAARSAQQAASRARARATLTWNAVIPLTGSGDRLLGLRFEPGAAVSKWPGFRATGAPDAAALASQDRRLALLRSLRGGNARAKTPPGVAMGPAVRAVLEDEYAIAVRTDSLARGLRRTLRYLSGVKRKLFPYQIEGVRRFLADGRLLLADDMGLGKTTQAIAGCHALYKAGVIRRGVIITPATLKSQWLREWHSITDVPVWVVDGNTRDRENLYRRTKRGFLIVNYELVLRDFASIAPLATELVVLDEAQRIKNYATKSAAYIKSLPAERRLVLTGTPMENRLDELASILDWVDERALAPKWRLAAWHTRFEGDGMKGRAGARNLDTLRARLAPCMVRRTRAKVLGQLPPRTDTRVPVAMTPEQLEEHESLSQPIAVLLRIAERRPLRQVEFLRLMQLLTTQRIISNGLAQIRFDELWSGLEPQRPTPGVLAGLFAPKLEEFRRLIEALVLEQDLKVTVFSQWRRMLKLAAWAIGDLLAASGRRALFFTGAESSRTRTQNLVDFHDDPRASVLFLTDAGGVGLNLQRAASACINLELPWNPAVLEQRIGRVHRLGQHRPISVFNLVSDPGIESRIATLVDTKQALFKGLFDGTSDELRFESAAGFIGQVKRIFEPDVPAPPADTMPEPQDASPEDQAASVVTETTDLMQTAVAATDADVSAVQANPAGAPPTIAGEAHVRISETSAGSGAPNPLAMFAKMRVERTADGGIRVEAPPEAAATMAAVFEVMARMLRAIEAGGA